MEQHYIPQHIASFQFRLVGPLTLKQFLYLGFGLVLAWISFVSPFPKLLRIPVSGFFGLFGVLAAFVPIQGRSLDQWLFAFIRAILSPTQRIWVRESQVPLFLLPISQIRKTPPQPPRPLPVSREKLEEFLKRIPTTLSPLDLYEKRFLESLGFPVRVVAQAPKIISEALEEKPKVQPAAVPEAYPVPLHPKVLMEETIKGLEKRMVKSTTPKKAPKPLASLAAEINFAMEPVIVLPKPEGGEEVLPSLGETKIRRLHPYPFVVDFTIKPKGEIKFEVSEELKRRYGLEEEEEQKNGQAKDQVTLPMGEPVQTQVVPGYEGAKTKPILRYAPEEQILPKVAPKARGRPPGKKEPPIPFDPFQKQPSKKAQKTAASGTTPTAKIPNLTERPNVLSGVLEDREGNPVEGAIVVVKDAFNIPVRAYKSNPLGQFLSSTPLLNGKYSIEIEKEGLVFDIISFEAKGQIFPPIEIKSK